MKKFIVALMLIATSTMAVADGNIEFKFTIPLNGSGSSEYIFGKPRMSIKSNKLEIDVRSSNRFIFNLGRLHYDTGADAGIVLDEKKIDIDLSNIYNYTTK